MSHQLLKGQFKYCASLFEPVPEASYPAEHYNSPLTSGECEQLAATDELAGQAGDALFVLRQPLSLAELKQVFAGAPSWVGSSWAAHGVVAQHQAHSVGTGQLTPHEIKQLLKLFTVPPRDSCMLTSRVITEAGHPCKGGKGAYAARDIAAGEFVGPMYGGLLVPEKHYFQLSESGAAARFLFAYAYDSGRYGWRVPQLPLQEELPTYVIDGALCRNDVAMVNDPRGMVTSSGRALQPNLSARCVFVVGIPCVFLSAKEDIPEGTELLVSYGSAYWSRYETCLVDLREQQRLDKREASLAKLLLEKQMAGQAYRQQLRRIKDARRRMVRTKGVMQAKLTRERLQLQQLSMHHARDEERFREQQRVAMQAEASRSATSATAAAAASSRQAAEEQLQAQARLTAASAGEAYDLRGRGSKRQKQGGLAQGDDTDSVSEVDSDAGDDLEAGGVGLESLIDLSGADADRALSLRVMYVCNCCPTGSVMTAHNKAKHTPQCALQQRADGAVGHWTGGRPFWRCPWAGQGDALHCVTPLEGQLQHAAHCAAADPLWRATAAVKTRGGLRLWSGGSVSGAAGGEPVLTDTAAACVGDLGQRQLHFDESEQHMRDWESTFGLLGPLTALASGGQAGDFALLAPLAAAARETQALRPLLAVHQDYVYKWHTAEAKRQRHACQLESAPAPTGALFGYAVTLGSAVHGQPPLPQSAYAAPSAPVAPAKLHQGSIRDAVDDSDSDEGFSFQSSARAETPVCSSWVSQLPQARGLPAGAASASGAGGQIVQGRSHQQAAESSLTASGLAQNASLRGAGGVTAAASSQFQRPEHEGQQGGYERPSHWQPPQSDTRGFVQMQAHASNERCAGKLRGKKKKKRIFVHSAEERKLLMQKAGR